MILNDFFKLLTEMSTRREEEKKKEFIILEPEEATKKFISRRDEKMENNYNYEVEKDSLIYEITPETFKELYTENLDIYKDFIKENLNHNRIGYSIAPTLIELIKFSLLIISLNISNYICINSGTGVLEDFFMTILSRIKNKLNSGITGYIRENYRLTDADISYTKPKKFNDKVEKLLDSEAIKKYYQPNCAVVSFMANCSLKNTPEGMEPTFGKVCGEKGVKYIILISEGKDGCAVDEKNWNDIYDSYSCIYSDIFENNEKFGEMLSTYIGFNVYKIDDVILEELNKEREERKKKNQSKKNFNRREKKRNEEKKLE